MKNIGPIGNMENNGTKNNPNTNNNMFNETTLCRLACTKTSWQHRMRIRAPVDTTFTQFEAILRTK